MNDLGLIYCFLPTRKDGRFCYMNQLFNGDHLVVVHIKQDGFVVKGRFNDIGAVDDYLRMISEKDRNQNITIMPSAAVPFSRVINVVNLCYKYELRNINLIEEQNEAQHTRAYRR